MLDKALVVALIVWNIILTIQVVLLWKKSYDTNDRIPLTW